MNVRLLSKDLVGVDLPGRFGDSHAALVLQLEVDLLVVGVFVGDDGLLVVAGGNIAVGEVPHSVAVGLVVAEGALVVGAVVGEDPPTAHDLVLLPIPYQLVSSLSVGVSALSVLLPEHPPS